MFLQLFQSCFINKFQNIEMNGKNRIFTNRKTIYRKLYVNIVAQMNVFMTRISFIVITVFTLLFMTFDFAGAQISAPGSSGSEKTNYPDFNETDSIYIFCTANGEELATLRATTNLTGTKTFLWEKYNPVSGVFDFYFSESSDAQFSQITGLTDGGYRATITQGATTEILRAWVFNNWTDIIADLPDSTSNCFSFRLQGEFTTADLRYYDLSSSTEILINKDIRVQWKKGNEIIASVINPQIFNPPAANTDYTLRVYDKYGCENLESVTYASIVTKAKFSVDPINGEAPLEVTFTNQSENGDVNQYEWFFFYDLDYLKENGEDFDSPEDSIMIVAYDENPVYTYENSGTYMVKLVSKKISEFHTCVDTFYLEDYIVADTSFIAVPNVFTPNGDGTNDNFVVKFWSMRSLEISIFNRWGKKIHYWDSGDIRGFEGTWTETVWDGRLMGGRYASPGVYYYNVVGEGRDGERRRAHGFFHLFRGKD